MRMPARAAVAAGVGLLVTGPALVAPGAAQASAPATVQARTVDGVACTVTGTSGSDVLRGTSDDDVLCGLGGADVLFGGGGDDILFGGDGDDVLFGGGGDDVLDGGKGDDVVVGGGGADTLVDGPGADLLAGGAGVDSVVAQAPGAVAPAPFTPASGETNPASAITVGRGVTMVSQADAAQVAPSVVSQAVSVTVAAAPSVPSAAGSVVQARVLRGLPARTKVTSLIVVGDVRVPLANQTTEANGSLTLPALRLDRGSYNLGIQQANGALRWLRFDVD